MRSQKSKNGLRNPHMAPFDLILLFLFLVLTAIHLCAKFEVSSFNPSWDIRGSHNSKNGSRDPHMTHFDLICIFSIVLTAVHPCAKFDVSNFNRPRDI